MSEAMQLIHLPDRSRYVGRLGETIVATVAYRMDGETMIIMSTVTDPAHRGAGRAGELTRFALDDARARGLRVVARCPYTAGWIRDHPAYEDLVAGRRPV